MGLPDINLRLELVIEDRPDDHVVAALQRNLRCCEIGVCSLPVRRRRCLYHLLEHVVAVILEIPARGLEEGQQPAVSAAKVNDLKLLAGIDYLDQLLETDGLRLRPVVVHTLWDRAVRVDLLVEIPAVVLQGVFKAHTVPPLAARGTCLLSHRS